MFNYYIPFMEEPKKQPQQPMNFNTYTTQNTQQFFDPYNGFMRGNMFVNEYAPYKNFTNFPIKPQNEREELMNAVQVYGFALKDLNLYLDLHKNDQQALSLYRKYLNDYKSAINAYENKYGPLNLTSETLGTNPWSWIQGPWPWERS